MRLGKVLRLVLGCFLFSGLSCVTADRRADSETCLRAPKANEGGDKQIAEIRRAIEANDTEKVKSVIDGDSFRCPTGLSLGNIGRSQAEDQAQQEEIPRLMDKAVRLSVPGTNFGGIQGKCRDGIVPLLIDAGVPISADQTLDLAEDGCIAATRAALPKMSLEDQARIISKFSSDFSNLLAARFNPVDSTDTKALAAVLGFLDGTAAQACKERGQDDPVCNTRPATKREGESLRAYVANLEAQAKRQESPEGVLDSACEVLAQIKVHRRSIDRENEVRAESGAVSFETLHEQGDIVVGLKHRLGQLLDEYRQRTGRAVKPEQLKCQSNE